MQHFYRKALVAFVLLLAADALIAYFCIDRSQPSASLLPRDRTAPRWHIAAITDGAHGGASKVAIRDTTQQSLRFDFRLSDAIPHPWAWAALQFDGAADLSAYSTVTFLAKCAPANSLILNVTVVDGGAAKPAMTFFSCDEKGTPVSLDLTRLAIPEWWYDAEHVDLSRRAYTLDRVVKLEFGGSQYSPRDLDAHVEIGDLTLHGRDDRYLVALAVILVTGWSAFGIGFFRAQSRALGATVASRLRKDLSFVAYRQLTVEPFEDKEKADILRFIATHYAQSGLDLDGVAAGTGAGRSRINDVLKAELGMTFAGYLKKLRLTEAARLLIDQAGATVAEIAYSVGYANSSYFNKLFKEEYGCSPKGFRNLASRLNTATDLSARPGAAARHAQADHAGAE
ncbi:AraC-type DNA-binding protein [Massilia sp. PDC64]|nr:helix-turn-helix domain-containing protein [Massilia sp. PDC64]SDD06178.1 AraC-type DNA-binding protein [Massilia sp. PDC64]